MDLSSNSQNIEDSFIRCAICQDYFTEPKLLPCYHRYCRGCLTKVVQVPHGKHLECPTCSQTCSIPDKGLDGLKTDYHMENMVEFQKIKSLFNGKAINDCFGCSENSIHMAGYCFKCKNFLCDKCYQLHLTNKMIADHKEKVISAKVCASDGFDLHRYIFQKEPQKCDVHVELTANRCCSTCNNLPVCLTCAKVGHAEHNLWVIESLAAKEKEKFISVKKDLEKCNETYGELIKGIEKAFSSVQNIDNPAARKVKDQHEREMIAIKDKTKEEKDWLRKMKALLDQSFQKQVASITENRDEEIRQITEKYNNKLHAIQMDNQKENEAIDVDHKNALQPLHDKQNRLEKEMEEQNNIAKQDQEQKLGQVLKLSEVVNQLADRMNNYNATNASVHVADNDWITIQSLPELHIACKRLVDDFERKYSELASILRTSSLSVTSREGVNKVEPPLTPFNGKMSVIEIAAMKGTKQKIQSITSCGKNRIAITGYESRQNSFFAIIDSEREQSKFTKNKHKQAVPRSFIASLSDSEVVIVSRFNLISIFNTQDLSRLLQEDISKIIPSWGDTWRSSCVATDRATKEIYVGAENLNIYVFNEHLSHVQTLDLSKIVTSIADILILERDLLVCDESEKRAYIVTRQGGLSVLEHEMKAIGRDEYCPLSACTDKEGFIFMLWSIMKEGDVDCSFAKYSQDGRTLITTGSLDKQTECVTIMEQSEGKESLVAASGRSNKMFLYTLPRSTTPHTKDARSKKLTGNLDKQTECVNIMEQSEGKESLVAASGKSNKMFLYTLPQSTTPHTKDARSKKPVEKVIYQSKYNIPNNRATSALRVSDLRASTSGYSSTQPGARQTVTSEAKVSRFLLPKQQVLQDSDIPIANRDIGTTYIKSEDIKQQGNRENSLDGGKSSQAIKRPFTTSSNRSSLTSSSARNTDVKKIRREDATSAISNMPAQRLSGEPVNLSH